MRRRLRAAFRAVIWLTLACFHAAGPTALASRESGNFSTEPPANGPSQHDCASKPNSGHGPERAGMTHDRSAMIRAGDREARCRRGEGYRIRRPSSTKRGGCSRGISSTSWPGSTCRCCRRSQRRSGRRSPAGQSSGDHLRAPLPRCGRLRCPGPASQSYSRITQVHTRRPSRKTSSPRRCADRNSTKLARSGRRTPSPQW